MSTPPAKLPDILEKMADVVLAYKPKAAKPKAAKPKAAITKKKQRSTKKGRPSN